MIDSHQHFWQLGKFDYSWLEAEPLSPIRRNYLPSDLRPLLDEAGVDKSVFVQTQHNLEENHWVLQLANENDWIAGIVGWVDLASADCEEQLLQFKDHPKFVGIRHVTHDEPDDDYIVRDDVIAGLRVLEKHSVPFDLLFFDKHLRHAVKLAKELPNLPMVIDHLSKPKIKTGTLDPWREELRAAAKFENVYCKISGMVTEADWQNWKADDLKPYVETALDAFGPERCMYGSDWPVCELAGTYREVFDACQELISRLSNFERQQICHGTATKFYSLSD